VSCRDDVEVVGRAILLVVLGTSQEFLVVHDPEICSLNGVVGVKGIGNPMFAVVVRTSSYLHFISYVVTLASFGTIGMDWRRLSSCIVSWVWGSISLDVGSVGYVVNGIASNIGQSICWTVSRGVGWSISCSVSSGVDQLRYFIFTSSLFSHRVEGTLATTSLERTLKADVAGIEPKQMSTGLARMSSMLSGKMTPLVEAIELHEEPRLPPT
jgi:hypothetical protein